MTKQELRRKFLLAADSTKVAAILECAFDEDDRTGQHFDTVGFREYFLEDNSNDILKAWMIYNDYHNELSNYEPTPPMAA